MGLAATIKRAFSSVVPQVNRAGGGIFVTTLPHGAGLLGAAATTLTGKATALNYGAVVTAISATANTTECWVEGVVFANPSTANKEYYVAITTATAITAAAQILGEVPYHASLTTDVKYVPLGQRVLIPAGAALGLALACEVAAGKTIDVWVVISRNK